MPIVQVEHPDDRTQYIVPNAGNRGLFGTTDATHGANSSITGKITDYTIPRYMAEKRIKRFANGCPTVRITTPLTEYKYQLGDMITFTDDRYLAYGKNGMTSSDKWEIIYKEPRVSDGVIVWEVAWADDTQSITESTTSLLDRPRFEYQEDAFLEANVNQTFSDMAVFDGFDLTEKTPPSLILIISAGIMNDGMRSLGFNEDVELTMTASKDTYVYVNRITGAIVLNEQNNSSSTPTDMGPFHVLIGKVITDGTNITSIDTTMQYATTVSGDRVHENTLSHFAVNKSFENISNMVFNGNFLQYIGRRKHNG